MHTNLHKSTGSFEWTELFYAHTVNSRNECTYLLCMRHNVLKSARKGSCEVSSSKTASRTTTTTNVGEDFI